jgi:hypothetical protein
VEVCGINRGFECYRVKAAAHEYVLTDRATQDEGGLGDVTDPQRAQTPPPLPPVVAVVALLLIISLAAGTHTDTVIRSTAMAAAAAMSTIIAYRCMPG